VTAGPDRAHREPDVTRPRLPDSIDPNVAYWTRANAAYADARADAAWAAAEISWGEFGVVEEDLGSPLGDVAGLDVVELGCGTAYFSAWLARRGARPVGVDPTPAQLATARRMQAATGITFPLVEAPGERVPLPDASFDLAVSEYGAALWADPDLWIPEAARLLRPGGRLVFLTNSVLVTLCLPDTGMASRELQRPQSALGRIEWPEDGGSVEYHPSHGDWIRILRSAGFEVEGLIEVLAPADAVTHDIYDFVSAEWARQWPAEDIWIARKRP
jgi:SAM-dependent methyltransferase